MAKNKGCEKNSVVVVCVLPSTSGACTETDWSVGKLERRLILVFDSAHLPVRCLHVWCPCHKRTLAWSDQVTIKTTIHVFIQNRDDRHDHSPLSLQIVCETAPNGTFSELVCYDLKIDFYLAHSEHTELAPIKPSPLSTTTTTISTIVEL